MFVAILTYVRPLEEIDALMGEHVRFLETHYDDGLLIASGRQVPRTGGVILIRSGSTKRVQSILAKDPFVVAGMATFELIEFRPSRMQEDFEAFACMARSEDRFKTKRRRTEM